MEAATPATPEQYRLAMAGGRVMMTQKSKVILSICIMVFLVAGAFLLWAYKTGRITIFGDQVTSNVNFEVKGTELNNGTADSNISLANNKIQLKTTGSSESGTAWLNIKKRWSDQVTKEETIQKQLIGIFPSPLMGNVSEAMYKEVNGNLTFNAMGSYTFVVKDEIFSQLAYQLSLTEANPQVKILTNSGKSLGQLYWQITDGSTVTNEKYFGLDVIDWEGNGKHELYVNPIGLTSDNVAQGHLVKIAETTLDAFTNNATARTDWYKEQLLNWTGTTNIKPVIASDIDSDASGAPEFLWDGENKGTYFGLIDIIHGSTLVSTNWVGSFKSVLVGILTSDGITTTSIASSTKDKAFPFYEGTNSSDAEEIEIFTHSSSIVGNTSAYPNKGVYTYQKGDANIIKFNTFTPVNQIIPSTALATGSSTTYQVNRSGTITKDRDNNYVLENDEVNDGNTHYIQAADGSNINLDDYIGQIVTAYGNTEDTTSKSSVTLHVLKITVSGATATTGTSIGYRFSGSTDGTTWADWNNSVKSGAYQYNQTGTVTKHDDGTYWLTSNALTSVFYQIQAADGSNINFDNYIGKNITAYGDTEEETATSTYLLTVSKFAVNQPVAISGTANLSNYIPEDSKYVKVEVTLTSDDGTATPTLDGFTLNYDINGVNPNPNPNPDNPSSDSSPSTFSAITSLVSTGAALWFNIIIALLVGGLISWLMLRKHN